MTHFGTTSLSVDASWPTVSSHTLTRSTIADTVFRWIACLCGVMCCRCRCHTFNHVATDSGRLLLRQVPTMPKRVLVTLSTEADFLGGHLVVGHKVDARASANTVPIRGLGAAPLRLRLAATMILPTRNRGRTAANGSPSFAVLAKGFRDNDAGPGCAAAPREPLLPGVSTLGNACECLGPCRRRPSAGQAELPRSPIAPRAASTAKCEGGVTRHQRNFVAFATPLSGAPVGDVAPTRLCIVSGRRSVAVSPCSATFAPPGPLTVDPEVLVASEGCRRILGPSSPPQSGLLRRGEHCLRNCNSFRNQWGPFGEEVEGDLLVVGRLWMKAHSFSRQFVRGGVGADVPARGVIEVIAFCAMSLDPANPGGLVAVACTREMVEHDARVNTSWRQRLAGVGIRCLHDIVAVAPNVRGTCNHPFRNSDADLLTRLRCLR